MLNFYQRASELKEEIIQNRRYLHQNAEVGHDLPVTAKFVADELTKLGLAPEEICQSGIICTIKGGKPGKTILLRADMDALPMKENSGLPFATKTEAAHCCGHDLHVAMLLCAAKMLSENAGELHGNVKLMFQPGEEVLTGAKRMLEAGLMENPKVDAALDMHVLTNVPCGTIGCKTGATSLTFNGLKITVRGKGCHGAQPHTGIDPINAAAHIHIALQALIAREAPTDQVAALTFGQFHAGTAFNIIPETAELQGSMRTSAKELQTKLYARVEEVVEYTAKAFGTTAEIDMLADLPCIISNPQMTEKCVEYMQETGMPAVWDDTVKMMGSDDFALISELVPSVFFAIGAAPYAPAEVYPIHNPNVVFNEDALVYGAAIHAQAAYRWLADNKD